MTVADDIRGPGLYEGLEGVRYGGFDEITARIRELSDRYSGLPVQSIASAFASIYATPDVLNRRVKGIGTLPGNYGKSEIEEMLKNPDGNEQGLRSVVKGLEHTSYPLRHARRIYQDLLTYHNYVAPCGDPEPDERMMREWRLADRLRREFRLESEIHRIAGQAVQEGKVFYFPRYSVDKPHGTVRYAFMQQLPSDFVKIIGYNSVSRYTLAFNMMYFTRPGTDIRQYGDLFLPYAEGFAEFTRNGKGKPAGAWDVYGENHTWFYWVQLPVDRVFTFEVDDALPNCTSPLTGLVIDLMQLVAYENVQMELVQNPLVSILTGEIPYFDDKGSANADQFKLTMAGRTMFEVFWYNMLQKNNTGGIGLYTAPFHNMQLHQLAEAPSAMQLSANGYGYALSKAGLSGIVPTNSDTRSGMAQISLQIEGLFAQAVYRDTERMFGCILRRLGLKNDFALRMFGTLATEKADLDECRAGMTLGILPMTLRYLAMHGLSLFDDIGISRAVEATGIMDMRLPLASSYNAAADGAGRPESDDPASSEGHEGDVDSPFFREDG